MANISSKHSHRFSKLFGLFTGLEENLVSEKPWYLQGETTADKRPVNSVLESSVYVDNNILFNRQLSQIPFECTKKLDDKIKERILEMRFDNVIRTKLNNVNKKKLHNIDYKNSKARFDEPYDEAFELALNTKEKETAQTIFKALCTSLNELSTPFV